MVMTAPAFRQTRTHRRGKKSFHQVGFFTGQLDAYAALDAAGHAAIDRANAELLFPGLASMERA